MYELNSDVNTEWSEADFKDHMGRPAHSVWYSEKGKEPSPPKFSFQVYSTGLLPVDYYKAMYCIAMRNSTSVMDDFPSPGFDFYSPLPDLPACVEHSRREIAHRIATSHEHHSRGLIPKVAEGEPDGYDDFAKPEERSGFAIIITVDVEDCAEFPVFARFTWPGFLGPIDKRVQLDMEFERQPPWTGPGHELCTMFRASRLSNEPTYDYGGDEVQPTTTLDAEKAIARYTETLMTYENPRAQMIFDRLTCHVLVAPDSQEPAGYLLKSPTIPEQTQPKARYIIYAAFPGANSLGLERIARHFMSTLVPLRSEDATLELAFYLAPGMTTEGNSIIQRCIDHTRKVSKSPPSFELGTVNTPGKRYVPQDLDIKWPLDTTKKLWRTCSVVLTSAQYAEGAGICMALTDLDPDDEFTSPQPELSVWQMGSMQNLATRLTVSQPEPKPYRQRVGSL